MLAKWIYKVVIVGNTCMHHLLLGIDPSYVGLAPYAPVMRHPLTLPARDLFLKLPPEARVCLLPLVAGFVGADAVAVALATRIDESPALRIAVDIGTNGEVLLGSRERLWACSAPAGPALEGAQIRHGMRAAIGRHRPRGRRGRRPAAAHHRRRPRPGALRLRPGGRGGRAARSGRGGLDRAHRRGRARPASRPDALARRDARRGARGRARAPRRARRGAGDRAHPGRHPAGAALQGRHRLRASPCSATSRASGPTRWRS